MLSIVAFVISLLGFNIIAVILGFIALNQVNKSGERGKGFANAAIIIGLVTIILGFVAGFFALAAIERDGASAWVPTQPTDASAPTSSPVSGAADVAVSDAVAAFAARPAGSSVATSAEATSTAAPTSTAGWAPTA